MPRGLRGGKEIYWRVWGDAEPDLLMIHCALAHSGVLGGLAGALGRPAVAFDMPGHGKSAAHGFDVDLHTEATQVATDFLGETPMDIIGHSFGATIALRLALEYPDAVRRLVLIEPLLFAAIRGSPMYENHIDAFQPFIDAMRAGDAMLAAKRFTAMWGIGVAWEDLRDDQRQTLAEQILLIPEQNASIFEDNARMLAPGRLESLNVPVLMVQGALTEPVVPAVQAALAARIPNVETHIIEGTGHMAPITHPTLVADVIRPFLTG